jgi:membrane fusion protein, heavy metal efflux system
MPGRVRRSALLSLLSSCLALGSLGACRHASAAPNPAGPHLEGDRISYAADAPELAALAVTPAEPAAAATVRATGRLAWDEDRTARVVSPVAGRVVRLLADVSTAVGKGQALALIQSPDLGQAQADAARAATDLDAASRTLARERALYENGSAPRKDVEAAEADRARSAVESERARARLALLGGGTGAVDQRFRLASPIGVVVVDRAANPGQEVRGDTPATLFTVSDPTRLWVYLDLTEQDLGRVEPGMALVVHTAAYPGRDFAGRVEVVGDALDPATRTVKARGSLGTPSGSSKPRCTSTSWCATPRRGPASRCRRPPSSPTASAASSSSRRGRGASAAGR